MITAIAQAIRNYKTSEPCCYMPGTKEHTIYWETMQSIKRGELVFSHQE